MYTATSGALVAQSAVDTIANNLANVNTAGFKQTLLQIQAQPQIELYRIQTDPGQLPNARTRELDALALIDEGGVLDCGTNKMIFGHALYEGLVLGTPAMVARAVVLSGQPQHADDLLAARLGEPLAPEHLPRTTLAPIQYFKHD